jgi:hypothetical protein
MKDALHWAWTQLCNREFAGPNFVSLNLESRGNCQQFVVRRFGSFKCKQKRSSDVAFRSELLHQSLCAHIRDNVANEDCVL